MNVFISWSGALSGAFAELLVAWLPDVIQRVKPWLSSENIDKGSIWSNELNEALATTVGILCVTQENKNAPWLLFEAGALSKGLTKARVCPLLIDLRREDVPLPLSIFNLTLADKADMWKLVKSINSIVDPENKLEEDRLKKAFDQQWPRFESESAEIRQKHKTMTKSPERSEKEMIVEMLEITRAIQRAMERAESKEQIAYSALSAPLEAALSQSAGYSGYSGPGSGKSHALAGYWSSLLESMKAAEKKHVKETDTPSDS